MKITSVKVETTYTISLELDELNGMLVNPRIYTDEPLELTGAGCFGLMQLTDNQAKEICFQLGYDKYSHIGNYNKDKKVYTISLVNNGDTL